MTTMMAFFLVLWLVAKLDQKEKQDVQDEIRTPRKFQKKKVEAQKVYASEKRMKGEAVTQSLEKALQENVDLQKLRDHWTVREIEQGIEISLQDTEKESLFSLGQVCFSPKGQSLLLGIMHWIQEYYPQIPIGIVGHTDAAPFKGATWISEGYQKETQHVYSNWDLSLERANRVRLILEKELSSRLPQIVFVQGQADKQLLFPQNPLDARNRRISLVVFSGLHPKDESQSTPEKIRVPMLKNKAAP